MKNLTVPPFQVIMRKEIGDHIRSWRFIIMLVLIALTFFGSLYIAGNHLTEALAKVRNPEAKFVYLKLLTTSDGSLPTFHIFLGFLGPLLGIALGFDAINAEQNNSTLIRLMAQPVYRDNVLLAKFFGALTVVSVLFLSLVLLMVGAGMLITGVPIEAGEAIRILGFVLMSILYVAFWLSLSILLSVLFRNAATSALVVIGIWLFFTVFYGIIVNLIMRSIIPDSNHLTGPAVIYYNDLMLTLMRFSPSQLYTDASTTLLMPTVRSLGPLSREQMINAIPMPLSFRNSLMIVWPQVTGLLAATMTCFAGTYYFFMRREIRS